MTGTARTLQPLELGLMVEGQEGLTWGHWRALAAAAETHGFDGLYTSDHYLSEAPGSDRDALDAWGVICALAALTTSVRLGTLVSPATFRHPSVLAKLAVTADHVSGGRIDLAMGTGWYEEEHRAYGFRFPSAPIRMEALEEQVEVVRRSWDDGMFSIAGVHYEIDRLDARPKPVQRPHPRLVIGGRGGPRSLALAARWADEYNSPLPTDAEIGERRAALADACERAGRDPAGVGFSIMAPVLAGADRADLEQRAGAIARFRGEDARDPAAALADLPDTWIVGTPEQIVARLKELSLLGVDRVVLEATLHTDLAMIELIGREVLPALRPAAR
jgi:alkanesulfonate monooxygenase SsuD/methylene tetrahydromethanopterin reductase-like flavin-dependent oxidoreductase (luciferase family)